MTDGADPGEVLNRKRPSDKEGREPTHKGRLNGQLGRKAGVGCPHPLGKERARRGEPTGLAGVIGLSTVARKGGEDEKQGEQQTQGKIT